GAGRARTGASRPDQSAAQDGQRHSHSARGLGLGAVRSCAAAAGGPRDRAGAEGQMAEELREPLGSGEDDVGALAALLHGTRARSLGEGRTMHVTRRTFLPAATPSATSAALPPRALARRAVHSAVRLPG